MSRWIVISKKCMAGGGGGADVLTPVHPVDDGLHGALRGVAVQDHAVSLLCL